MTYIPVLYGGTSTEREVSIVSGRNVYDALLVLGYRSQLIDTGTLGFINELIINKPDLAFIALHGGHGENGNLQGLLEVIGVPYTHSGVRTSAIFMNKIITKKLFISLDIPTPEYSLDIKSGMQYPYVIKPISEGSSTGGMAIIKSNQDRNKISNSNKKTMMLERYISGREFGASVFDGKVIGITEVFPKGEFYSYEVKYTPGMVEHMTPADVPDHVDSFVRDVVDRVASQIEMKGPTIFDFILDPDNVPSFLEINTHPGLTKMSFFPQAAKSILGLDIRQTIEMIVQGALNYSCGDF